MNLWERNAAVQEFVFNPRLAEIAAKLIGVKAVRIYHDQVGSREVKGTFGASIISRRNKITCVQRHRF